MCNNKSLYQLEDLEDRKLFLNICTVVYLCIIFVSMHRREMTVYIETHLSGSRKGLNPGPFDLESPALHLATVLPFG